MTFLRTLRLASILSKSLADDFYFLCFFRRNWIGQIARLFFFINEIRLRKRDGLVLETPNAVALVGLSPYPYLHWDDLSFITKAAIRFQQDPYTSRWKTLSKIEKVQVSSVAYLSAIACHEDKRGRGEGGALIKALCEFALEQALDVHCEVSSSRLVAWYEKLGFSVIGHQLLPDGSYIFQLKY